MRRPLHSAESPTSSSSSPDSAASPSRASGEFTIRPLGWLSFRAGDDFTVHFSKKGGSFVIARWDDLCKLARQS